MAVRIKDGVIPYTGGIGIEITNNHVINVLLRALNNLIHYTGEDDPDYDGPKELYVDLQLPLDITPDDELPIGVNIGRVLEENGWFKSGTLISGKTSSSDFLSFFYSDDGHLYYNPGTTRIEISDSSVIIPILQDLNTKTFFPANLSDSTVGQRVIDWYLDGKDPILIYNGQVYVLEGKPSATQIRFQGIHITNNSYENNGYTNCTVKQIYLSWDANNEFVGWMDDNVIVVPNYIMAGHDYTNPYNVTYDSDPATKKYVDDGLATKQDILTPGTRITIDQNNVISADVSGVLTYKGNVTGQADLPSSGNTVGDCYFVTTDQLMFAWDGTQWNQVGSTQMNLTNYFNKTTDDSDDITQGSQNLFVTSSEKNTWNNKQNQILAGDNITINADGCTINATDTTYTEGHGIDIDSNNQISNTLPFEPENTGVLSQVLKRTSTGYRWAAESAPVTSVNGRTGDVIVDEFSPDNAGSTGQVLKKTSEGYQWSNESVTSVNGETGNVTVDGFEPENDGSTGQVLKKTSTGYKWQNESSGGGGGGSGTTYYGGDYISINSSHYINNDAPFVPSGGTGSNGQVLTKTSGGYEWKDGFKPETNGSTGQVLTKTSTGYNWENAGAGGDSNVKLFVINSDTDYSNANAAYNWLKAGKLAILKYRSTYGQTPKTADYYYYPVIETQSTSNRLVFQAQITTNNYMLIPNGRVRPQRPAIEFVISNNSVSDIVITSQQASRTETVRSWIGTQSEYDAIEEKEVDVVYNIIPNS